jgi:hypothetical protein
MNLLKLLGLILLLATSYAQAQTSKFELGIEGGPNLSTFRFSGTPHRKPIIFGSGGFMFQHNLKRVLSFKTGLSFQRKGYQVHDLPYYYIEDTLEVWKGIFTYDYITLPFLVKASFGKKVKFFVNAGPYGGFLLSRKRKWVSDHETINQKSNTSSYQRLDFGIVGGIGISVPIKKSWMINAEVSNYFGLQDITDVGAFTSYTNTTDLRLGVVYRLGLRNTE